MIFHLSNQIIICFLSWLIKSDSIIYILASMFSTYPIKGFPESFSAFSCVESKIKSSTTQTACPVLPSFWGFRAPLVDCRLQWHNACLTGRSSHLWNRHPLFGGTVHFHWHLATRQSPNRAENGSSPLSFIGNKGGAVEVDRRRQSIPEPERIGLT